VDHGKGEDLIQSSGPLNRYDAVDGYESNGLNETVATVDTVATDADESLGQAHQFEFDELRANDGGLSAIPARHPDLDLALVPIEVRGGEPRSVRIAIKSMLRDSMRVWRRREWWDSGHVPKEVEAEARLQAFAQATLRPKCGWPHAPAAHSQLHSRSRNTSGTASVESGISNATETVPDPCDCPGFRARRRGNDS